MQPSVLCSSQLQVKKTTFVFGRSHHRNSGPDTSPQFCRIRSWRYPQRDFRGEDVSDNYRMLTTFSGEVILDESHEKIPPSHFGEAGSIELIEHQIVQVF